MLEVPEIDQSAAFTVPTIREPANAVNPIFVSLFIFNTPSYYININIKHCRFIKKAK